MSHPILKIENLHKRYNNIEVLKGVSFVQKKGDTIVLIGPSGTGKTTLLRCINLLSPPDKGHVWVDGIEITNHNNTDRDIDKLRSDIGFVFQSFNLFIHLSILDNVRFGPMRVKGIKKKEATEMAMEELARVGLTDKANAYPAELSGGQQQRAAIARALAMKPKLILFDEPTSALDNELIGEVLNVMMVLAKSGMTLLIVTHEMEFASSVASEIIFLDKGEIIEQGPPEKIIQSMNVLYSFSRE